MPHVDTPQSLCRVGIARCDITPPVGIYHRMWGAARHDRAWYGDSVGGVRVNLAKGTATGEGTDRLASVEDVIGSNHPDVLVGGSGANALWGQRGKDRLYGAGGKDRLDGGSGKDYADGGPARDVCHAEKRVHCP